MQGSKTVEAMMEAFQSILEKDGNVDQLFEKAKKPL